MASPRTKNIKKYLTTYTKDFLRSKQYGSEITGFSTSKYEKLLLLPFYA
jgi:hypothetical protein